jgi:two-component system nitrate/nitrite response regulator NarL
MGSQLLSDAINRDRRLEVANAVATCIDFAEAVASCNWDVLLLSASLDENPAKGFDVLRELRSRRAAVKAVMLLDASKREAVIAAFQAGAKGIFCRNSSLTTLSKCICSVHAGQIWANSTELEFLVDALANRVSHRFVETGEFEVLSKREQDVVRCVSNGLSNHDIAERLKLSEHTVKNYLFHIFEKLGVSSRLELMFKVLSQPPAMAQCDPERDRISGGVPNITAWHSAAGQGFPVAQLALGGFYRDGLGIPKDNIRAYTWFWLAQRTSDEVGAASDRARRALATEMTPAEVAEAERQALELMAGMNEMKKSPAGAVFPSSGSRLWNGKRNLVSGV